MNAEVTPEQVSAKSPAPSLPFIHRIFQLHCLLVTIISIMILIVSFINKASHGILFVILAFSGSVAFWSYTIYKRLKSGKHKNISIQRYCIFLLVISGLLLSSKLFIPNPDGLGNMPQYITILIAWIIYFRKESTAVKNLPGAIDYNPTEDKTAKPLGVILLQLFFILLAVQALSDLLNLLIDPKAAASGLVIVLFLIGILFLSMFIALLLWKNRCNKKLTLLLGLTLFLFLLYHILNYFVQEASYEPAYVILAELMSPGDYYIYTIAALLFLYLYTGQAERKWFKLDESDKNDTKTVIPGLFIAFVIYIMFRDIQIITALLFTILYSDLPIPSSLGFIFSSLSLVLILICILYMRCRKKAALLLSSASALACLGSQIPLILWQLAQLDHTAIDFYKNYITIFSSFPLQLLLLAGFGYIIFSPSLREAFNCKNMSGTIQLKHPLQTALFMLLIFLFLADTFKLYTFIYSKHFQGAYNILDAGKADMIIIWFGSLTLPVLTAYLALKKEKYRKTLLISILLLLILLIARDVMISQHQYSSYIGNLLYLAFVYFYAYTGPEQEEANSELQTNELQTA